MSEHKHTPGPWTALDDKVASQHDHIATVVSRHDLGDARLIAAAPRWPRGGGRLMTYDNARLQEQMMGPRSDAEMAERHSMFRDHNCYRCDHGKNRCVYGSPRLCSYPRARND